jgi:RNA polymerase sigma-70 factor, ECF subfamily
VHSNNRKWLRSPSERVGTLSHADLPPPVPLPSQIDEEQLLVRALRERDEQAFESLLDRWYSPMLRLARTYVRSRADAEEVVQDTWLAVLSGIDRFEGRSSLKTWIFRILVNRARTRARREARTTPLSAMSGSPTDGAAGEPDWLFQAERIGVLPWHGQSFEQADPHSQLVSEELRVRIEMAVRSLPSRQQEVITLRDLEGWSAAEVCETLDLSDANQRVLLHRARMRVRDALYAGESS